jgi:hypothetical protein
LEQEPVFLTREQIDTIHRDQLEAWGGLHGIRSEDGLESAIAQPQNVYFYGAPYGVAVFSLKQNGVTVSEAGVPASRFVHSPELPRRLVRICCRWRR